MMNDLNKFTRVAGKPRFRAIALTDNMPLVTAWGNDSSFAVSFAEPLRNDVVLRIATLEGVQPAALSELNDVLTKLLTGKAGYPAVTVPAGYTADGMPVGVSFIGPAFSEGRLLALAQAFERARGELAALPDGL